MRNELSADAMLPEGLEVSSGADTRKEHFEKEYSAFSGNSLANSEVDNHVNTEKYGGSKRIPFELYKRRTTVIVIRETFLDVVCNALSEYKYVGLNQRADLVLACRYLCAPSLTPLAIYDWRIYLTFCHTCICKNFSCLENWNVSWIRK